MPTLSEWIPLVIVIAVVIVLWLTWDQLKVLGDAGNPVTGCCAQLPGPSCGKSRFSKNINIMILLIAITLTLLIVWDLVAEYNGWRSFRFVLPPGAARVATVGK